VSQNGGWVYQHITRTRTRKYSARAFCNHLKTDHFHYDVTHAKVSGSCSKDRAQCRAIAGKFKIIHKNTCNAMAAELVDHITSLMCITERTSSDISDKPAFTPPGHIKREQCKSKEALFCKIFDFFFIVSHSVRYKTF